MSLVNYSLSLANKYVNKKLLEKFLFLAYRIRGLNVNHVSYYHEFNAWEYVIDDVSYFSSGPGWAYSYPFLFDQIKKLSCYSYLPKQGDVVLDIGAGVGEETIIFSKLVGIAGCVYGIEAHPKTFGALSRMIERNDLKNVIIDQVALNDVKGTIELTDTDNSLANSMISSSGKKFYVQAITLDDFIEKYNITRVDLLKMNVEGAEQFIIKGMTKSISIIKHIAISCHDFLADSENNDNFRTKERVIQFLKDSGFELITQQSRSNMVEDYVYGTNPSVVIDGN